MSPRIGQSQLRVLSYVLSRGYSLGTSLAWAGKYAVTTQDSAGTAWCPATSPSPEMPRGGPEITGQPSFSCGLPFRPYPGLRSASSYAQ